MHRSIGRAAARALAAALAAVIATGPAYATVHRVRVMNDGSFKPKALVIASGDTVEWYSLRPTDAVARLSTAGLAPTGVIVPRDVDADAVCFTGNPDDPAYVVPANAYRQAYDPADPNELTGPRRHGVSGIWVLGPEGGTVSKVEIPSPEAESIHAGITAADGCEALNTPGPDDPPLEIAIADDPATDADEAAVIRHEYSEASIVSGREAPTVVPNLVTDGAGVDHRLCKVTTFECDAAGDDCVAIDADAARPETIAPGTYLNGLLTSTYANPDVTGVVLRFNWKDLQYDQDGVISERWQHLDREIERAIAHGKLVTIDVRAGMLGTPDWIFSDYLRKDALDPDPTHAAPWCADGQDCAFVDAPAGAGLVQDISFRDHYDEEPPGNGCGTAFRIGAPGDRAYRDVYKALIERLAAHLQTDTRWWSAVAHIKASGANLRTSEAELPHHCNDDYVNTGEHTAAPKDNPLLRHHDRVLDVFKTLAGGDRRVTAACACNPLIWRIAGYVPQDLYDYYAEVEHQILASFFGEKSIGYQIIQDGFPRADAGDGKSFYGDHLYAEELVPATSVPASPLGCGNGVVNALLAEECDDGCPAGAAVDDPCHAAFADQTDGCRSDCTLTYDVNLGTDAGAVCAAPSLDGLLPAVDEDRAAGTAAYCSGDSLLDPPGQGYQLALVPLSADPLDVEGDLAAHAEVDDDGVRYPASSEQSERVLDEAGNGRFADACGPACAEGAVDRIAGKLFVPQHSGIQPFPQEGGALGYRAGDTIGCDQEVATVHTDVEAEWPADWPVGWSAGAIDVLGAQVAAFPILASAHASGLADLPAGCPNRWIVEQGKDHDVAPFTLPNGTVIDVPYPAQLTGYQTTNDVRSPAHVESALMNLVYNTNAVFIELYEDAVWYIGHARGTGLGAVALDDPAAPVRVRQDLDDCTDPADTATCNWICEPGVSCYSKNLAQWAAELHLRRAVFAASYGTFLGTEFPGMQTPFPRQYRKQFVNTSGTRELHAYIDPAHCDPHAVKKGPNPNQASALGVIWVEPPPPPPPGP